MDKTRHAFFGPRIYRHNYTIIQYSGLLNRCQNHISQVMTMEDNKGLYRRMPRGHFLRERVGTEYPCPLNAWERRSQPSEKVEKS